jgi:hypothetical protein
MEERLRRFTRLVNAFSFSKKIDNLKAAVALYMLGIIPAGYIKPCG